MLSLIPNVVDTVQIAGNLCKLKPIRAFFKYSKFDFYFDQIDHGNYILYSVNVIKWRLFEMICR